MIDDLVDVLIQHQRDDGDLKNVPGTPALSTFLKSPLFHEKIERFLDPTYRPNETAGLYSDSIIVHVFDHAGWAATLIQHTAVPKLIYSLPFPTLIGLASPGSACSLEIYSYANKLDQDPGLGPSCKARREGTVELEAGQFWSPSRDAPAYRLASYTPGTLFLRITGPVSAPYSHAFEAGSLEYRHSGFSHQDVTCRDILARMAVAAGRTGAFSRFSPTEAATVTGLLDECIRSDLCAPTSGWAAIEALSCLEPERAEALVTQLAQEDGPLRDVARQTLGTAP